MGEVTYSISQAAKLVGVETYVLRFWEEELLLEIGRSEKGYRFYTNEDIHLLQQIKIMDEMTNVLKEILEELKAINEKLDTITGDGDYGLDEVCNKLDCIEVSIDAK